MEKIVLLDGYLACMISSLSSSSFYTIILSCTTKLIAMMYEFPCQLFCDKGYENCNGYYIVITFNNNSMEKNDYYPPHGFLNFDINPEHIDESLVPLPCHLVRGKDMMAHFLQFSFTLKPVLPTHST